MKPTPDQLIDQRYRVLEQLGSGGMGMVFRVHDLVEDRILALKVLASEGESRRDRLLRFRREFRAASALSHPNIVRVHEFVSGRLSYFTMEYVEGQSVAAYFGVDGRRMPPAAELNRPERVRRIFAVLHQILLALGYMHDRGIVHRDLKPDNIIVTEVPSPTLPAATVASVRLMDFGLARDLRDSSYLTQPGVVLGTLAYLSPEQASGRAVDGRADLYALGVILYRLLTGSLPFVTDTVSSILWKHCAQIPDPPRLRNPEVNRFLEAACQRLLRKDPFERFQSAADLVRAIERTARGSYELPAPVVTAMAQKEVARGQLFAPRLVGREVELRHLCEAVDETAGGDGGVCLVRGEPGIGRTRLVSELLDHVRALDVQVLIGRFHAGDPRPYGGLTTVLEDLVRTLRERPRGEVERLLGARARALGAWVPSVLDLEAVRLMPPLAPLGGVTQRDRQQGAAIELIEGFLGRAPLLVVLEDVERADELGRELLVRLAARAACRPAPGQGDGFGLLAVLTGGPADSERDPLASLVAGLPPRRVRELKLSRLGRAHAALLSGSMLGQEIDSEPLAETLFRVAQGVPLEHEEMTRLAVAEGIVHLEGGHWKVDRERLAGFGRDPGPAAGSGPGEPRRWLRRLLEALTPPARDLLATAALLGRECGFDVLAAASGLEEGAAIDAVDELLRGRLLAESRSGLDLACAHHLVRDALLAALEPERRVEIHRRILGGLERVHAGRLDHHGGELLTHAGAAGDTAKLEHYRRLDAARRRELGLEPGC